MVHEVGSFWVLSAGQLSSRPETSLTHSTVVGTFHYSNSPERASTRHRRRPTDEPRADRGRRSDSGAWHYLGGVLVRFPSGEGLAAAEPDQPGPTSWALPDGLSSRRSRHLLITDWIAKQKASEIAAGAVDI